MDMEKTLDVLAMGFLERLPARIDAIRLQAGCLGLAPWQPAPARELCRLLHSLVGAAGAFGQPGLGSKARFMLEQAEFWAEGQTGPTQTQWQEWLGLIDALSDIPLSDRDHGRWFDGGAARQGLSPAEALQSASDGKTRPRIHLLEDDAEQALVLKELLQAYGYEVEVFVETGAFRDAWLAGQRADLVLADMVFAERTQAGAEVMVELAATVDNPPPVVFLSVRDDIRARLAAFRAGASRYLTKPVQPSRLIELVDELSLRRPAAPYRVLVVDDDPVQVELAAAPLRDAGMCVAVLHQPLETLDRLRVFEPDLLLLNIYMPQASGPEIAAILREKDEFAFMPILFLSAEKNATKQLLALGLGGDDFLFKPIRPAALLAAVRARAWRARRMRSLSVRYQTLTYEHDRLLHSIAQGVALARADAQGNLTRANARFCALLGYDTEDMLDQSWQIYGSDSVPQQLQGAVSLCLAVGDTWQGRLELSHRDGHSLMVEATITPYMDTEGKPYQSVIIIQPE